MYMINGKLEQKTGTFTDGQAEEVIPTCVSHIHRHSFDVRSSKVFSLLVGMGVVCSLSLWGNIRLWQSNRQYAIHRDEKAIEWVRKQADGYENELKAVSDSLMQEKLKLQVESESD